MSSLTAQIDEQQPDVLLLNSMGESFANDQLGEVIAIVRKKNVGISLYGNGYLLGYSDTPGWPLCAMK